MADEAEELTRQYGGCTVPINKGGKRYPFIVNAFKREGTVVRGWMVGVDALDEPPRAYNPKDLELVHAANGLSNAPFTAIYAAPRMVRQYRKGMTRENTLLCIMSKPEMEEIWVTDAVPMDIKYNVRQMLEANKYTTASHVDMIINPRLMSPTEALQSVVNGERLSSAFTSRFFFIRRNFSSVVEVGYKSFAIGTVDENGAVTLYPKCSHYLEELSQYVEVKE